MTLKQFKTEFKLASDNYDAWGSAMEVWFECAGRMNRRNMLIPAAWEYRPGLGSDGTDKDSYWYALLARCSNKQLIAIGNLMFRYCQYLKYKEVDY